MDEANEPTERARPPALAPADEAMLARAQMLLEIVESALRDVTQGYPDDDHGGPLRDALFVQGLTERLVDQTVIVERERGASWTDIGNAAGISRQSAHERWNTRVGAWALMGRQRNGISHGDADPAAHARYLDQWADALAGKGPDAVSSLLPSLHDEDARTEANSRRTEAKQLHERAEELRKEIDDASNGAAGATGTAREEKRAVWAAKHFARAEVYDRLADLEGPVAAEHRRRAATQRGIAQDILRGRAAESLPTEGGTRERVYAAYCDLTPQERSGSKRAVAALLAEHLDGPGVDSVRRHLDPVITAYREKQRMAFILDIAACSDPETATTAAVTLLQGDGQLPAADFWDSHSRTLLSCYLMAAALDDASANTLHTWVAHPDDRRPVELLRSGPVPEWADLAEQILSYSEKIRANVLLNLQFALQQALPRTGGQEDR